MSLLAMTIPDDADQLPSWLEQQLVGAQLPRLVAELRAVHPVAKSGPSFDLLLRPYLNAVLEEGLSALPRDLLCELLLRPALLLELQEVVLLRGGPYWDRLLGQDAEVNEAVERGRSHVERLARSLVAPAESRRRWYTRTWISCLATAAVVLFVVGLWSLTRPTNRWGWDRPGALARSLSAGEYLNALADAAHEWFDVRPQGRDDLARRILQLRQGCSTLLSSEHRPLAEADRQWLLERCRKWASKFDTQLADLEAGKPPLEVRQDVDATVEQLIRALRQRGSELSG